MKDPEKRKCPRCKKPIKKDSQFCEHCGYNLSKRKQKKKKTPMKLDPKLIGIIAAIAIVAAVGIYIGFSGGEETTVPGTIVHPSTSAAPPTTTAPTESPSTASTTPASTTTPAPTIVAPTTPPPTTPAPTTPPPTKSEPRILKGEIGDALKDGRMYFIVYELMRSDEGGYLIDMYFQNTSEKELLFNPTQIKVVDAKGKVFDVRYENSQIKAPQVSLDIPCVLSPNEYRRVLWEFERGRYVLKKFIFVNEYNDGSITRWEIDL
ncbi:MAG: DUF2116 family Zn-ribbon domain-containing protein [Euryarchaeota archaeon]|nr:DUF2116 family Zn-ribbon domain-containing protein [Euryarchaeota archaeon]